MTYQRVIGSLCYDDYKGVNRQYVEQNKLVVRTRPSLIQSGARGEVRLHSNRGGVQPTLTSKGPGAVAYGISSYESNAMKPPNPNSGVYEADTGRTLDLNGGNPACNQGGVAICYPGQDKVGALMASGYSKLGTQEAANGMYLVGEYWDGSQTVGALTQRNAGGGQRMPDKENFNAVKENEKTHYVVRRLTPMECERLQGFPDGWTDIGEWTDSKGKKHKAADSARYKALGNSISLPNWDFVIKRISATSDRPMTMASLFDGVGGFPLLWERHNGKGSCLWASEIEEFPIAVTKRHFPEGT